MNVTISVDELKKRKIMVCTPMYGGMCTGQFTNSIAQLMQIATHYGITVKMHYLFNESLITRARNYMVDEFLRSDCTHLMFIDSDIGFDPNDVLALAAIADPESDKDIVCGPYPKKTISWEKIVSAVNKGKADDNPNNLSNYVGDFVFNPLQSGEIRLDLPVEVLESGTGFMMIQRGVFTKYAEKYPELLYLPDHARSDFFDGSREITAYFDTIIDPKTKRYLSEDYMFCQNARKIGIKVWLCPWMRLNHTGTYMFGGSLVDLAQIQAAATVDPSLLKKKPKKLEVIEAK